MNGWPVCPSDSVSQRLSSEMILEQVLGIVPAKNWAFNKSGSTSVLWSLLLAAVGAVSLGHHPSLLLRTVRAPSVFFPRGKACLVHYEDDQQGFLQYFSFQESPLEAFHFCPFLGSSGQ